MLSGFLLFFLLLVPGLVFATIPSTETTERTYCEDEGTRRDWEERTTNNPDDSDLQTLHALWLGLCVKIQREDLAVDQATDMFERVRQRLIEQRRDQSAAEPTPERGIPLFISLDFAGATGVGEASKARAAEG